MYNIQNWQERKELKIYGNAFQILKVRIKNLKVEATLTTRWTLVAACAILFKKSLSI